MEKNRLLAALPLCIILSVSFLSGCTREHKENTPAPSVTTESGNSGEEELTVEENDVYEEPDEEEQRRIEEEYRKNNVCIDSVKVTKSQVKLRWSRMEPGTGYRIYRYGGEVDDRKTRNLLAELSKDTCSYTDKDVTVGKNYVYEVVRIDEKKDGTVEVLSNDDREVAIGPGRCEWNDFRPGAAYYAAQFDTTDEYIRIPFNVAVDALKQDGYEIYRGNSEKDMKKIAVVKSAEKYETYKDTDVTPFATYYYNVRAFKKIDGKTYYGAFAWEAPFTAGNSTGKFAVEKVTDGKKEQSEQIIKMTSDKGNYDFEINKYLFSSGWGPEDAADFLSFQISEEFQNVQYSFDGTDWKNFTEEKVKVSKGESIYLLLRKEDNQPFRLDTEIYVACYYESKISTLHIDFRRDTPIGETEYEYTG